MYAGDEQEEEQANDADKNLKFEITILQN